VFADPQVRQSTIVQSVEHPRLGPLSLVGQPIDMVGVDASPRSAAPELGQDGREVLTDYGFAPDEIDDLVRTGVV
jgi:crotonobetainyl-CoA:carnitine CoA-transferase CaiB-like acyl-CoA transferase